MFSKSVSKKGRFSNHWVDNKQCMPHNEALQNLERGQFLQYNLGTMPTSPADLDWIGWRSFPRCWNLPLRWSNSMLPNSLRIVFAHPYKLWYSGQNTLVSQCLYPDKDMFYCKWTSLLLHHLTMCGFKFPQSAPEGVNYGFTIKINFSLF